MDKHQQTTNHKQWQMTKTKDKQQQTKTNDKQQLTTNDKYHATKITINDKGQRANNNKQQNDKQ